MYRVFNIGIKEANGNLLRCNVHARSQKAAICHVLVSLVTLFGRIQDHADVDALSDVCI